jgi:RNA polymerase sigma-70 factor (ECF subfamily)
MTTQELISAAQSGDRNALSALLLDHRSLVTAVVNRHVYDADRKKDIIQNIFIKVINHINQYSGLCKFSTWLYRICLNECTDAGRAKIREEQRRSSFFDDTIDLVNPNAADGFSHASQRELHDTIGAVLEKLPLDQKTVFSLFYFGGYSGKEIASALSISEANAFMKLKAARDAVKTGLVAKGWTP